MILSIISFICWHFVCIPYKNISVDSLPIFSWISCGFFFLILSCMSSLYSLGINPLLDTSFTNIFSHSEGHLFFLLMVFFVVQKPFSLMQFHLFTFARFPCLKRQVQKDISKADFRKFTVYVFF